jgi:hypothetical protein
VLLCGALFAKGRRTVTSWLRAAGVGRDFGAYSYFLAALGRRAGLAARRSTGRGASAWPSAPVRSAAGRWCARQYGAIRAKRTKTFEATWPPAGGRIRVVRLRQAHGWLALFSTDPTLTAQEVLSAAADRFRIEKAQADYPSSGSWAGARRIASPRRDGVARVGRVLPATPARSQRSNRSADTTRRPTPPHA